MSKKLISLVLVLALASLASAVQWDGAASGAWEVATNWTTDTLPAETDTNCSIFANAYANTVTVSTAVEGSRKPQMKAFTSTLIINSGGSMSASGSFEQGSGTGTVTTVTVNAGGLLDVCKKITITTGTYKIATTGTSTDTVNIYGTVRVKNQGSLTTADSDILIAGPATSGNGYVNIYGGGLLDVDKYTVNSRGLVKIWEHGTMKIKGNVTTQTSADIAANRIIRGDTGTLTTYYSDGATYVVPEPATLALLGLGSLTLLRRKR